MAVYTQLDSVQQIRLLKFLPRVGQKLSCSLYTYLLCDCPPYYGVSYTWGSLDSAVSIDCNNEDFTVTNNLAQALFRLENFEQADGIDHFWVDQICINQDDLDERAHHVQIMGSIFSQAFCTLIWLGSGDPTNDRLAIALLDRIDEARTHPVSTAFATSKETKIYGSIDPKQNQELGLPAYDDIDQWKVLTRFMMRRWFYRVWVVQEAVLSSKSPILLTGNFTYAWDKLERCLDWLIFNQYTEKTAGALSHIRLHSHITALRSLRDLDVLNAGIAEREVGLSYTIRTLPELDLEHVLMAQPNVLQASDMRDHVYSLYALASDTSSRPLDPALMPDYRKDPHILLEEITRYVLRKSQKLTFMSAGHGFQSNIVISASTECWHHDDGFASWVPRWYENVDHGRCLIRNAVYRVGEDGSVLFTDRIMARKASRNLPARFADPLETHELALKGFKIAPVLWCSSIPEPNAYNSFATMPIREPWEAYFQLIKIKRRTDNDIFLCMAREFRHAWTNGQSITGTDDFDEPLNHFFRYLTLCYEAQAPDHEFLDVYRELGQDGDERRVRHPIYDDHRLFFGETGWWGFGPPEMKPGDYIYVLLGGDTPYILRKICPTHHAFLGEAYVVGLMGGNAIELWEEGGLEEVTVRLR